MKSRSLLAVAFMLFGVLSAQNPLVKKEVNAESLTAVLGKKLDAINDSIYTAIILHKIKVYKDFTLKDTFKAFGKSQAERNRVMKNIKGISLAYNGAGEEMSLSWLYPLKYSDDSSKILVYGELCAFDIKKLPKVLSIRNLQLLVALGNIFKLDKKAQVLRIVPSNVTDIYYTNLYRVPLQIRSELQSGFYRIKEQCLSETPFLKNAFNDSFYNIIDLSVYMTDTLTMEIAPRKTRSVYFRVLSDFSFFEDIIVMPDRVGLKYEGFKIADNMYCREKTVFLSRKLLKATQLSWIDFMFDELVN